MIARRPASIRWFERLFYLRLAVTVFNAWLLMAYPGVRAENSGFIMIILLVSLALNVLLLFQRDSRDWFAGRRPIGSDIFS